ncbi:hypothetical protein NOCA1200007 [metagenome]|uniref:Uncharacterized protein n=1 Tax=metagenome TaxID=256318 RepID=A0A2P2CE36_9ZZZZ
MGACPVTGHDTHTCDPCGWCDLAVGSQHGDPYVFPAGVAELEHVFFCQQEQGFEHPITEYQQAPQLLEEPRPLERVLAPTGSASRTSCRAQRSGPGRTWLRSPGAGGRRGLARPRARRRCPRPVDRAVRP